MIESSKASALSGKIIEGNGRFQETLFAQNLNESGDVGICTNRTAIGGFPQPVGARGVIGQDRNGRILANSIKMLITTACV